MEEPTHSHTPLPVPQAGLQVIRSRPHKPNFCENESRTKLVCAIPNGAKISKAKLVKEYVFDNAENQTK